jgi:hypothetical protein
VCLKSIVTGRSHCERITVRILSRGLYSAQEGGDDKVDHTSAWVKTCNSQDMMSATWRKERSTVETNEIMKTAAHRSESWCWHQLLSLLSWCLSWRNWCAAALREMGKQCNALCYVSCRKYSSLPQWLRSLRHEPSLPARTLGPWIRIQLKAWMSVCVYSVFVLFCV